MSVSSFDIANDRAVSDVFTSGRVLPYKFEYRKEDGEWKFDLMPVISSLDTVLPQLARESNIGENEFIFRLLEMQSGAKVTESIWDPLIPSGSIGFATRYGEITAVGSAEDKQVTTITALGVSMSIPATAKQVPIQDPAVVMYKAPESGLSWLIERRGNGTMRSLPVPLTKMAGMFADAIGYKEPIETVATEIGGEACERLSFSHRGKSFIMFVVFWSGYVYGLCVTSDKEYDGNLTSAGEKLRTSVEFTLPELYETPPRLSSLDDIGVIYNPYEGLWITPVGDDETIVLFDPKKRTTMIVHRSKATGADPNGPDIDNLRQQLQSEGFISVEISEVTVGGHRAWRSQGTVKTSKGEMNFCIIHMLRVGNYAYEMHGSADIDSRDALSEFVTEIVGKMTFR